MRDRDTQYGDQGDAVDLSLTDRNGRLRRYRIRPLAPGWVAARPVLPADEPADAVPGPDPAIRGAWQNADDGYTLELRLPRQLLNGRLSLRLLDSNSGQILASAPMAPVSALGRIVKRSAHLDAVLAPMSPPATRIRITDHQGLVLASAGRLDADAPLSPDQSGMPWFVRDLLLAILPSEADTVSALRDDRTQLFVQPVVNALAGHPGRLRRQPPAGNAVVVSAAVPIRSNRGIRGAVLVEQTTNAVLSADNLALQRLFGVTLLFFAVTGLGLLGFASLLASRIIGLRDQVEAARVEQADLMTPSAVDVPGDEIDTLRNHFADLSAVLRDNRRALDAITIGLDAELNGPVGELRRSLANDDSTQRQGCPKTAQLVGQVRRLEAILGRLREVQALRQSVGRAPTREFDLAALLRCQLTALGKRYHGVAFALHGAERPIALHGVSELIGRAIAILVDRAMAPHTPDGCVQIDCRVH